MHPLSVSVAEQSNLRSLVWFSHINALIKEIVGEANAFNVYLDKASAGKISEVERAYPPSEMLDRRQKLNSHLITPADCVRESDTYLSPSFFGGGWRFRLRADIHIEYFTLTYILDQPRHLPSDSDEETKDRKKLNSKLVIELNTLFAASESKNPPPSRPDNPEAGNRPISSIDADPLQDNILGAREDPKVPTSKSHVFQTLWEKVHSCGVIRCDEEKCGEISCDKLKCVKPDYTKLLPQGLESDLGADDTLFLKAKERLKLKKPMKFVGERFADFRSYGTDLLPPIAPEDLDPSTNKPKPRTFLGSPLRFRHNLPGGSSEDDADLAIWPHARYLEANEEVVKHSLRVNNHAGSELALTGLIDGKALYVSTLGRDGDPKDEDNANDTPANTSGVPVSRLQPLRYILTYSGDFPFQRGRVIRMLHEAGVLRIMALRDLRNVRYASQVLRQLGQHLSGESGDQLSSKALRDAYDKYLEASRGSAGELGYRTARSQHYIAHWQQSVSELRQRRVEGWQMYDEFIRRRQGSTFDFIARVGSRNATVIEQFETAFAARHAQKAAALALVAVWVGLPAGPLAVRHFLAEVLKFQQVDASAMSMLAAGMYVLLFWKSMLGELGERLPQHFGRLVVAFLVLSLWALAAFSPIFSEVRSAITTPDRDRPAKVENSIVYQVTNKVLSWGGALFQPGSQEPPGEPTDEDEPG